MRITPLDIRKQPFRKNMMGFDKDEVNSFLEMVATEYEQLIRENDRLSTKVKNLQERIDEFEKIEKTLNETLLSAQRATDDARMNAQKEAELIIKDAQIRADKYEVGSRRKVNDIEADINSLKTQRDSFLIRFKSMLRDQLLLLDVISGEIKKENINGAVLEPEEDETMDEVPPHPVV